MINNGQMVQIEWILQEVPSTVQLYTQIAYNDKNSGLLIHKPNETEFYVLKNLLPGTIYSIDILPMASILTGNFFYYLILGSIVVLVEKDCSNERGGFT